MTSLYDALPIGFHTAVDHRVRIGQYAAPATNYKMTEQDWYRNRGFSSLDPTQRFSSYERAPITRGEALAIMDIARQQRAKTDPVQNTAVWAASATAAPVSGFAGAADPNALVRAAVECRAVAILAEQKTVHRAASATSHEARLNFGKSAADLVVQAANRAVAAHRSASVGEQKSDLRAAVDLLLRVDPTAEADQSRRNAGATRLAPDSRDNFAGAEESTARRDTTTSTGNYSGAVRHQSRSRADETEKDGLGVEEDKTRANLSRAANDYDARATWNSARSTADDGLGMADGTRRHAGSRLGTHVVADRLLHDFASCEMNDR